MSRNPDALAVHPYATPIDDRLGGTAGKAAPHGKEILQRLVVLRLANLQLFNISR
jgi:hypothetical protein